MGERPDGKIEPRQFQVFIDVVKGKMCKDCANAMISRDNTELCCIVIQNGSSIDCDYAKKCSLYKKHD